MWDREEGITKYHLKSSVFKVRSNITKAGGLPNLLPLKGSPLQRYFL
jgi:hypothetical protein